MKKKSIFSVILTAAFLFLAALPVRTAPAAGPARLTPNGYAVDSRIFKEQAPAAPGQSLFIDRNNGSITIISWDKDEIALEVRLDVECSDRDLLKEYLDGARLVFEPVSGGRRAELVTKEKERNFFGRLGDLFRGRGFRFSHSARFDVKVPSKHSLTVDNSFGDVTITAVTGRLAVRNQSGKVIVDRCGGDLDLRNSFAEAEVTDFNGPVTIADESGDVSVRKVTGNADIRSRFKSIRALEIGGGLTVRAQSSDVNVGSIAGDARIESSFRRIDVRDVRGRLEIKGESSAVSVDDAGKDVRIDSTFQPVRVKNVKGRLDVTGQSAGVTAEDIGLDARIKSTFNPVTATRVHGSVTVEGESSAVTLRDIDGSAVITTSFHDVSASHIGGTLDIRCQSSKVAAADVKLGVTVRTNFGSVELRRVGGGARIEADSAGVLAEDVSGDIDVKNSFQAVVIRGAAGAVVVRGESSPVDVSMAKGFSGGATIDLRTSFNPITLALPADANVEISAKTEFGKIVSDFPVLLAGVGPPSKIEPGRGKSIVRLETSGNITIRKAGEPAVKK